MLSGAGSFDELDGRATIRAASGVIDRPRRSPALSVTSFGSALDSFADLDSNANGRLDDADAHVSVVSSNSVIDLSGVTGGAVSGDLTVVGVIDLESSDFLFA